MCWGVVVVVVVVIVVVVVLFCFFVLATSLRFPPPFFFICTFPSPHFSNSLSHFPSFQYSLCIIYSPAKVEKII